MLDAVTDGLIEVERDLVTVTLWLKLPDDVVDKESVRVDNTELVVVAETDELLDADRE